MRRIQAARMGVNAIMVAGDLLAEINRIAHDMR